MSDFWVFLSHCGEGEIKMIYRCQHTGWRVLCKDERELSLSDVQTENLFEKKSDKEAIRMANKNLNQILLRKEV